MRPRLQQQQRKWFMPLMVVAVIMSAIITLAIAPSGQVNSVAGSYYDLLADAFVHGQLHLRIKPTPELLALSDPYDPETNWRYRLHDALLYQDQYYLYWGPAPALLLMPVKALFGMARIADAYLVLLFTMGIVIGGWLIIRQLHELAAPQAPQWITALGVLVMAASPPLHYILARPAVYEAAILGGQCFLLFAFYCVIRSWHSGGKRNLWAALAGVCAAFAVGSRFTLLPAAFFLGLMFFWSPWNGMVAVWRRWSGSGLFFGVPLAVGIVLLGWYNFARFGSWTEIGVRYQLSSDHIPRIHDRLSSVAFIPANLYNYILRPPTFLASEPFVVVRWGKYQFPKFIPVAPNPLTVHEPMVGILAVAPWVLFAAAPLLELMYYRCLASFHTRQVVDGRTAWLTVCVSGMSILCFAPLQLFAGVTIRYLADFAPMTYILAVMGAWRVDLMLHSHPSLLVAQRVIMALLALYTIVVGLLLGLTGYYHPLSHPPV